MADADLAGALVSNVPPAAGPATWGWRALPHTWAMTLRTRRPTVLPVLLLATALVVAACAGDPTSSAAPSVEPSTDATPAFTAAPGASELAPTDAMTQTDTAWGRIWDAAPSGFPVYPGAAPATAAGPDPASGTWAIEGGDALEIASWMQTSLETATYSTEAMSGPFEDGSFIIESVGDGECRIHTTIAPLGGLTTITVLYGAACPFG